MRSQAIILKLALGLACLLATLSCETGTGADDREPTSVILITLDTVRADHLSLYGYRRPTSPMLDAFAQTATTYTRAHSPSSWTFPSHASLFTGLYPFEHGAHRRVQDDPTVPAAELRALADRWPTLAEFLNRQGFETGAVVANESFLAPPYGLDRGFDFYDNRREHAPGINRRIGSWLDAHQKQPFFLFVNYMDAHQPCNLAPRVEFPELGTDQEAMELNRRLRALNRNDPESLAAPMLRRIEAQYDLAIANLDEGLGQLFDELRARELFDDALIIVTSDHGDLFGEHGLLSHSRDVYQGLLHIPLVVKRAGQQGAQLDRELISLVHLPGLILQELGLTSEVEANQSLLANWPRKSLFAENHLPWPDQNRSYHGNRFEPTPRVRSVHFEGEFKYIHSSDGKHELFNLASDPDESKNLIDQLPEQAREAAAALELLERARANAPLGSLPSLGEADLDKLRELGYAE